MTLDPPPDLISFMGVHNGFLRLVVASDVENYENLRGAKLAVDSPISGYVLVLRKMLELNGLGDSDYTLSRVGGTEARYDALKEGKAAGTLLTEPFGLVAQSEGLRVLGRAEDALGDYQGSTGACLRG